MDISVAPASGSVGSVFDEEEIVARCEPATGDRLTATAQVTVLAGRPAVICRGTELSSVREIFPFAFHYIELPSRRTLVISPWTLQATAPEIDLVDAILASLMFEDAP